MISPGGNGGWAASLLSEIQSGIHPKYYSANKTFRACGASLIFLEGFRLYNKSVSFFPTGNEIVS